MKKTKTIIPTEPKVKKTKRTAKKSIQTFDEDKSDDCDLIESYDDFGYNEDIDYYRGVYDSMKDW